jgi:hypothetical protein
MAIRSTDAIGSVAFSSDAQPAKSMTTRLPLRTAEEIVYLAAAVVVAVGGS